MRSGKWMSKRDKEKKKTFVARRTMLTKRKEPLSALKERFPWLFDSNEVWDEFGRICGSDRREAARAVINRTFEAVSRRFFTKDLKTERRLDALLQFVQEKALGVNEPMSGTSRKLCEKLSAFVGL
ncbi:hypothetical protein FJT64_001128 [Amphibalanus amphitrite]|uniref:Uncharacterized protein n=1 Tax=Amphibalanus amphitrite TaxID=1232801 RepID=A0A6A4VM47_AMPAM|nr:hypothetical protein FJT64_001128 [Amphibalanus amphitrite]